MGEVGFSVLICTYNRHELLRQALTALVDGTVEKPDEVVVVNGGDARADAVVQEFAGRSGLDVRLIRTVNVNLATSRNVGLAECRGAIVAMTDDDAEVYPDWVTLMKEVHATHADAGAVGGAVVGACSGDSLVSRLADLETFPSPELARSIRTLPGVNISYKREALDGVGLQDETLFRGEDVDFNWRVKRLGYDVYYEPSIRVTHHHRPSLRQFLRQHYMYGRAYVLVRGKWPEMYCVYPHGIRCPRDAAKMIYFGLGVVWNPLRTCTRLRTVADRLCGFPVLVLLQLAWRAGMLCQALLPVWHSPKR